MPQEPGASDTKAAYKDPLEATRMPLTQHLEELRACLIRAIAGLAVCTIVSLIFAKHILAFIITPALVVLNAHGERPELLALSPIAPFLIYLRVGLLSGLLISTPWILHQIWTFVSAGLYETERRWVRRLLPVLVGLFLAGVAFMFFIVLPIVLNFLVSFNQGFDLPELRPSWFNRILLRQPQLKDAPENATADLQIPVLDEDPEDAPAGTVWFNNRRNTLNIQTPNGPRAILTTPAERRRAVASQYGLQYVISLTFGLALGFGLAFELPVVVVALAATGLVPCATMARSRRYVLFGIVVLAAFLTPPDVISQILLAVPMYALFEAGLIVGRSFERRRSQ